MIVEHSFFAVDITVTSATMGHEHHTIKYILVSPKGSTTTEEIVSFFTKSLERSKMRVIGCNVVKSGNASDLFPGRHFGVLSKINMGEEMIENIRRIEEATATTARARIVEEIVQMRDEAISQDATDVAEIIEVVARAVYNREVEFIARARDEFAEIVERKAPELRYINLGKNMGVEQ